MDVLDFILKVQSVSKIGLLYSKDEYAIENYEELQALSKKALEELCEFNLDRNNYFDKDIYPTPSVSVRGYVLNELNQLLFVKEKSTQTWSIPGGWCDIGDTPKQSICLELLQEAGIIVEPTKILSVLNRNLYKDNRCTTTEYSISFHCQYISGQFKDNHETCDAKYFSIDQLPVLSHKVTKDEICKNWQVIVNDLATVFD